MVQKYQNEISPTIYDDISTKINEKDLQIPNLQLPDWKHPYWMTLYNLTILHSYIQVWLPTYLLTNVDTRDPIGSKKEYCHFTAHKTYKEWICRWMEESNSTVFCPFEEGRHCKRGLFEDVQSRQWGQGEKYEK